MPAQVFIARSQEDTEWWERLRTMLVPLNQVGVSCWDESQLEPGQHRHEEIAAAVEGASVAVMMASPAFLASEFVLGQDLSKLIAAAHQHNRLKILWLAVKPCLWQQSALASYQPVHDVANPLSTLSDAQADTALAAICQRILAAVATPFPATEKGPGSNPYRGLSAFQVDEWHLFFGRTALIEKLSQHFHALCDRPDATRLLVILGPSGSGKSSVARAGLLAALNQSAVVNSQSLRLAILRPGTRPVESLARALLPFSLSDSTVLPASRIIAIEQLLRDPATPAEGLRRFACDLLDTSHLPFVVFVDQFEEAYTLCTNQDERDAFVGLLLHASSDRARRVAVIVTLRSDFLGETQKYHNQFNRLIAAQGVIVPALSPDELRDAIAKPAELQGRPIDEATVEHLLAETRDSEGALPLVEFALTRIWEGIIADRAPGATLREIGGVGGSLASKAQEIYGALNRSEQATARRALVRLVRLGEGTRDTRRRAPIRDLCGRGETEADVWAVLRKFTTESARLVTLSRDGAGIEAEVTHEALFDHWHELRNWINESRADRRFHDRITESAHMWNGGQRQVGRLWRSPDLDLLRNYAQRKPEELSTLQTAFLQAAEFHQRRDKLLRWSAIFALILAAGILVIKERQWTREAAKASERIRQHNFELAANQGARAALWVQQPGQAEAALALAISAAAPTLRSGQPAPPLAQESLMITYSAAKLSRPLTGHSDSVESAVFDPSGQRILTGSHDQTARLWNARTGELIFTLSGHTGMITSVGFSQEGKLILTTSNDGTARIWESQTGVLRWTLIGHTDGIQNGRFSPLGDRVVTAGSDHSARIWDSQTGQQVALLSGHTDRVIDAAFLPSGLAVVTVSFDKTVRLWNSQTGAQLRMLCGHTNRVNLLALSSDGERVVSGSWDQTALLWHPGATTPAMNSQTNETASACAVTSADNSVVLNHGSPLHALSISPSGDYIATAGTDGVVKLWDGHTGALRARFVGHSGVVDGLGFSPNSQNLISAGRDRTVRLWNVHTEQNIAVLRGHSNSVFTAAFAPSGAEAVTASYDKTARIWDVRSGTPVAILQGHNRPISSAEFSPDGTRIATAGYDYTARMWSWPEGEPLAVMSGHRHVVNCIAFSPDGTRLATASTDADVGLWDGHTGQPLRVLSGHRGAVFTLSFSPDGRRVVSGGEDGTLRSWDVFTGMPLRTTASHSGSLIWTEFAPDGSLLVSTGTEGETILHNPETLLAQRALPLHHTIVDSAVFQRTAAGLRLITAAEDRSVRIWDAATATELDALTNFPDNVISATLSPSGTRLLILSKDSTVRLWDLEAKLPLITLPPFDDDLTTAAYSRPDGRYFLVGSANGFARIYPDDYRASLTDTLADACNLLRHQPVFEAVRKYCP